MGVKCILIYKLPKGVLPSRADAGHISSVLTEQLCCVPVEGKGGGDKQTQAVISTFKQTQAPDLSVVSAPTNLHDVRLFKLPTEAPDKTYLVVKGDVRTGNGEVRVIEAEPSVQTFMEKRLDYKQRTQLIIQSHTWSMGGRCSDVTVRLLQVSQQGQVPKVLALEFIYHPAVTLPAGRAVLSELGSKICQLVGPAGTQQPGWLQLLDTRFTQAELPTEFGPMHTVLMYNDLLTEAVGSR